MPAAATIAIVGAGPAGLIAAEVLAGAGRAVTVYDHLRSPARKLLIAGRGGLNLTHSEDIESFIGRYGAAAVWMAPLIRAFPPAALREWCEGLGQATFVGSSGRVFPVGLKSSPLLRAWLRRLDGLGVRFVLRRRWTGWDESGRLTFTTAEGDCETVAPAATLLALGGASWPRLGADGAWVEMLVRAGLAVAPLRPANCGFVVPWSEPFAARFVGTPVKPVTVSFGGRTIQGEVMITAAGLEGGPVYALSAALRDTIAARGSATLTLDLRPGLAPAELARRLAAPRGSQSLSTFLRKAGGLAPVAVGLLRQAGGAAADAGRIKALPVRLTAPAPIGRAISSAGGVTLESLDTGLMLRARPGLFVAGEMLDWEAPTGGYLLQGCFATGVAAARGVLSWLNRGGDAARSRALPPP
ncbi:MAG: TIGR03862 family flavoprotein [Rhodospirillaceae bacterium]